MYPRNCYVQNGLHILFVVRLLNMLLFEWLSLCWCDVVCASGCGRYVVYHGVGCVFWCGMHVVYSGVLCVSWCGIYIMVWYVVYHGVVWYV